MSASRRNSLNNGMLKKLYSGMYGENINSVIARLYKNGDYDMEKAQHGIVFLNGLDKLCSKSNRAGDESARQQVFKEILDIVQGTMLDVSRFVDTRMSLNEEAIDIEAEDVDTPLRTGNRDEKLLDTAGMFFVCFGGPPDGLKMEDENDANALFQNDETQQHSSPDSLARTVNNKTNCEMGLTLSLTRPLVITELNDGRELSQMKGSRTFDTNTKKNEKYLGYGPGGGREGENTSRTSAIDDLYYCFQDNGYDDGYYDDVYEEEEEQSRQLTRLLQICEAEFYEPNSSISECRKKWGMNSMHIEFTDGALELIAQQAVCQNTGKKGIENILEKLLIYVMFDLLGNQLSTSLSKIEMTQMAVTGKAQPKYYLDIGKRHSSSLDSGISTISSTITTKTTSNVISGSQAKCHRMSSTKLTWSNYSSSLSDPRKFNHNLTPIREESEPVAKYNSLTDFDQNIYDKLCL